MTKLLQIIQVCVFQSWHCTICQHPFIDFGSYGKGAVHGFDFFVSHSDKDCEKQEKALNPQYPEIQGQISSPKLALTSNGLCYSCMDWFSSGSSQTVFAVPGWIDSVPPEEKTKYSWRNKRASPKVHNLLPNGLNQHIMNEQDQLFQRWNTLLLHGLERPLLIKQKVSLLSNGQERLFLCKLVSIASDEWKERLLLWK